MRHLGRPHTVTDLTDEHRAVLLKVRSNPRHAMWPVQRNLLVRLGLIRPVEPPRAARPEGRMSRPPPPRAYELTTAGIAVLEGAS